jgi:hypothetical protein
MKKFVGLFENIEIRPKLAHLKERPINIDFVVPIEMAWRSFFKLTTQLTIIDSDLKTISKYSQS